MQYKYEQNHFLIFPRFEDNDLARRAGFSFDRAAKVWKTPFYDVAKKLLGASISEYGPKYKDRFLASFATDASIAACTPPGLSLLPYQKAGVRYLLDSEAALLADDPGLGKTIQVIAVANALSVRSTLIICPASLKTNWVIEWKKWSTLGLDIGVASGDTFPETPVVVVNYDLLPRFRDKIRERIWDILAIDEAHYCKNPDTKRTIEALGSVKRPGIKAKKRIAMTGTPLVNRPSEAFPLLKFLLPFCFSNFHDYGKRYCAAKPGPFGWDYSGASNLEELQGRLRSTVMIRRLKKDVLKELPAKRRQIIEIDPDKGALKVVQKEASMFAKLVQALGIKDPEAMTDDEYALAVQALSSRQVGFEEATNLRLETALETLPYALEHLENSIAESGKVVAFCHHREIAKAIKEHFGEKAVILIGGMSEQQKHEAVTRFQTDSGVELFVGNIQAAGVGLTLTTSSHVVFVELDWVPGNVSQAEDRTHRIGQKDCVLVQHLVLKGSIAGYMAKKIVSKQEIIDKAVNDPNSELNALLN